MAFCFVIVYLFPHRFCFRITKTRLFKYIENFTFKNWKFSDKNSDIVHISAQNIDCGYSLEPPQRGGSNEYPQSMFLRKNKKKYVCKPLFYCIKWGLRRSKYLGVFSWWWHRKTALRDGGVFLISLLIFFDVTNCLFLGTNTTVIGFVVTQCPMFMTKQAVWYNK